MLFLNVFVIRSTAFATTSNLHFAFKTIYLSKSFSCFFSSNHNYRPYSIKE